MVARSSSDCRFEVIGLIGIGPLKNNNSVRRYVEVDSSRRKTKHGPVILFIIICLVAAVLPPIIINALYDVGDDHPLLIARWTAADSLSYFGMISAAVIAIAGVVISGRAAWRSQESQLRDDAAPYFAAIFLDQQNKRDALADFFCSRCQDQPIDSSPAVGDGGDNTAQSTYTEVEIRTIFAIIGDAITYKKKLSDNEREHVESSYLEEEQANGGRSFVPNSVIYMPIEMKNVGKGAAVGVRVGINKLEDSWTGVSSLTLGIGESFYLGVYIDTSRPGAFGEDEMRVAFSDCLGYQYMQTFQLRVVKNTDPHGSSEELQPQVLISYLGTRRLLNANERREYLESLTDVPNGGVPFI